MRDPHVVRLVYRLEVADTVSFENAPAIERDTDSFTARLADDRLQVRLKDHFPGVESARGVVDPWLRGWEIYAAIQRNGQHDFSFAFEDSELIDRDPPRLGEAIEVSPHSCVHTHFASSTTVHVTLKSYPGPPTQFLANEELRALWSRFQNYRKGKEPLLSMAYFCLSFVEKRVGGGRRAASNALNMDFSILDKLGHIVSTRGNLETARKDGTGHTLTAPEEQWISAALLGLFRQLGTYYAAPGNLPPTRLTMADLPSLPP